MSGRFGALGYVYQGIVAVLNCLETGNWEQIKVEPVTPNDKVDIVLKKGERILKAIQVKSSQNKFEKPSIKEWIDGLKKDIEADEYELVLVGNNYTFPAMKYCEEINGEKSNTHITRKNYNEEELLREVKGGIVGFLELYQPDMEITTGTVENVTKRLLADIMLISTNSKFFKKSDMIRILNENVTCSKKRNKKKIDVKTIFCGAIIALWLFYVLVVFLEGGIRLLSVSVSTLLFFLIWGLMKYSDYYYWKVQNAEKPETFKSNDKCGCKYIDIFVSIDHRYGRQKVYIKNRLDKKIDYVKGKITFYFHDTREYIINFTEYDIRHRKNVKIDDIDRRTEYDFFDKTYWDRVDLELTEIIVEGEKAEGWYGNVIRFSRIPDFEPKRYICVGTKKIVPYELSWLYKNIIIKIKNYIYFCWSNPVRIYIASDKKDNFKTRWRCIRKNALYKIRALATMIFLLFSLLAMIWGQVYVIIKVIEHITILKSLLVV